MLLGLVLRNEKSMKVDRIVIEGGEELVYDIVYPTNTAGCGKGKRLACALERWAGKAVDHINVSNIGV